MNSKSNMGFCSYEEAVDSFRSNPGNLKFVEDCYLDADPLLAAVRFAKSEELEEVSRIINKCKKIKDSLILDLGCGNGIASYSLALMGAKTFAADVDQSETVGLGAAAKLAAALPGKNMSVINSAAEDIKAESNFFDVVYIRQALHHFKDLEKGITECFRVLKPGGLFIATREHVVDNGAQLKEFLENHPLHCLHGGENAYALERYLGAIEKSGLVINKIFGPFDSAINHFPIHSSEVKKWLKDALAARIGPAAANLLVKFKLIEKQYRKKLSKSCKYPGRLYSFTAFKAL